MKHKKIIMSVLLIGIVFSTSGCGNSNYIKDQDNKVVMNEETGQSVQKDILCKPTEEGLYKIYEQYNDQLRVKLEDLRVCTK